MKSFPTLAAAVAMLSASAAHAGPVCYVQGVYAGTITEGRDSGMTEEEIREVADKSAAKNSVLDAKPKTNADAETYQLIRFIYHDPRVKDLSPTDMKFLMEKQCIKKHGAQW